MIPPRYAWLIALLALSQATRADDVVPTAASAGPTTASAPSAAKPASEVAPAAVPTGEGTVLPENPLIEHVQLSHGASAAEIASLLRLGHSNAEKKDYASAEIAFMQVLAEKASPEQDQEALLGLARTYRKKADFTKAAAVYERFIKQVPNDPRLPSVYLELGRTMRALGAYKQAISRFYSVLNSTLKLPDDSQEKYRQLARTAQYEIAETYFQTGDYAQATHFFSRLSLLDLAPEDRALAHFKSVYALALAGEDEKAITGLKSFLEQNPDDENVPEARYLLALSLRRVGRTQESLRATLELLRMESTRTQKNPTRWAYWQRKTGNQLANDFYQAGDFVNALAIYENLSQLSNDPSWSLPATYQLGLCYERLRRFDKARDCYHSIVDGVKSAKESQGANLRGDLSDLGEMAAWRLTQLSWEFQTESELSVLFPPASDKHQSEKIATSTTAAKADSDHDPNRNPAVASRAL
jgi:tetratricopeptide (TPR) repeat protein